MGFNSVFKGLNTNNDTHFTRAGNQKTYMELRNITVGGAPASRTQSSCSDPNPKFSEP